MDVDLLQWLSEQLDEDIADVPDDFPGDGDGTRLGVLGSSVTMTPQRARTEIGVKRRMLDMHRPAQDTDAELCIEAGDCASCVHQPSPCETVRLIAEIYADRPGYEEQWRPVTPV